MRFTEVINGSGAVEDGVFRLGDEIVYAMTEFVEEQLDLVMAE